RLSRITTIWNAPPTAKRRGLYGKNSRFWTFGAGWLMRQSRAGGSDAPGAARARGRDPAVAERRGARAAPRRSADLRIVPAAGLLHRRHRGHRRRAARLRARPARHRSVVHRAHRTAVRALYAGRLLLLGGEEPALRLRDRRLLLLARPEPARPDAERGAESGDARRDAERDAGPADQRG